MINSNERIRIFRYLLQDRVFPEVGIFLFEIFDFYRRIELYHQFFSRKGEERPDGKPPVRFIADTDAGQSPVVSEQFVCVDKRSLTTQGSGFFIQAVQKEIRLVGTFETFDKIRPGSLKDIENTEFTIHSGISCFRGTYFFLIGSRITMPDKKCR